MPSKKDLVEYYKEYDGVPISALDRIYDLLDGMNDRSIEKFQENLRYNLDTNWDSIQFVFSFIPKATPRARFTRFGGHFYVSDAANNQKLMLDYCKEYLSDFPMIATACKIKCDLYFPTPKGMTKEEKLRAELKQIRHVTKPDWDNIGKTYSDMVQGTVIMDDSLIIESHVYKYYSTKPRIEMEILYADRYDSKYNERLIKNRKQYKDYIPLIEERNIETFKEKYRDITQKEYDYITNRR